MVVDRRPRTFVTVVAGAAAVAGGLGGGPVAAVLAAVYAGGGATLVTRHRRAGRRAAAEAASLDAVADLAAELRAGAPVPAAMRDAQPVLSATPARLAAVLAACRVSEDTGAPLADVLDRVEAQLRQDRRLFLAVSAHGAGTRATALLLAVLPAGGLGLGYGMGADPLALLLDTRLGAGCALAACVLQFAGMVWAERLSKVDTS